MSRRLASQQPAQDDRDLTDHGRVARLRPGARLEVRGFRDRARGPVASGIVLLARVVADGEEVLVPTREYGRRWFHTSVTKPFRVVKELS